MRAIRIQIVASYLRGGGTLVDADQCFRIRFDGPREIVIEILGHTFSFHLGEDFPVGNWVTIDFSHDGVNRLGYSYSWELASGLGAGTGTGSPLNVPGQVPPVGSQGIWFGNRIGAPTAHLDGGIQSVKIWRIDPRIIIKNFLRRPFTPTLLECWGNAIRRFREAAVKDPDCAASLKGAMESFHDDLLLRLGQKSPQTLDELSKMLNAYQALWGAGKVGSPEMQELMARLRQWLENEGVFSSDDPDIRPILDNPCVRKFTGAVGGLECDPDAQTLIKAILGLGK